MSPDGGATWHDVAFDLATPAVTIDPAFFAGAEAPRLRVTATDGVNSHTVEVALAESGVPSKGDTPSTPPTGGTIGTPTQATPGAALALVAGALGVAALAARRRA